MFTPNFKTWSVMIKDYCLNAKHKEAISFYLEKTRCSSDFQPNSDVIAALFKSCSALKAIQLGKSLHSYVRKTGDFSCNNVSKSLLNLYAKNGYLTDCVKLFGELDGLDRLDTVIWNIVLSGFANCRSNDIQAISFFNEMIYAQEPSSVTISTILPVCTRLNDLKLGKTVHSLCIKSGLDTHTLSGNSLVSFYAKCGKVTPDAYTVFSSIYERDVVSWNAMIAGFVENKLMNEAFGMFSDMAKGPIQPNSATLANVLPICGGLDEGFSKARFFGREIHGFVVRRSDLASDVSICNALLTFYSRTGQMGAVEFLFTQMMKMKSRDLVSWNSVISGYASKGEWLKGLVVFKELISISGFNPDSVTILSILHICANLQNLHLGRQIHNYAIRHHFLLQDTSVGNALVNLYAKCNETEAAISTFLMIPVRDLVSWNSVLDSLTDTRYISKFLSFFERMLIEKFKPDTITILTLLKFSVSAFSREVLVKEIHCFSIKAHLVNTDTNPAVGNAILDAYAKCGKMDSALKIFEGLSGNRNLVTCNSIISGFVDCGSYIDAYKVFDEMTETDLTTWNLMIRVYSENDCIDSAIDLLDEFRARGMKPDEVTLMTLLPLCAEAASLDWLRECHGYIVRNCYDDVRLKSTLLDSYAKCGAISCSYKLFRFYPRKDLMMFTAMIYAFAMHGIGEKALDIYESMTTLGIKPDHVIFTSVLSACSHGGLVESGLAVFDSIETVYGMHPTMEEYSCVVDLLARAGRVHDAYEFITKMPLEANVSIWSALLGACRNQREVELGRVVAGRVFEMGGGDAGNYVVLSNMFAGEGRWGEVVETRKAMRGARVPGKVAGCSWIEVEKKKSVFVAGDCLHPQRSVIYEMLLSIDGQMKEKLQS